MILVAGLVVAGLVGIAAAFYFSIRSGNGGFKRNSRVRSGDRAGADRHPGGRRSRGTSDERPANGHRAANNSRAANPASLAANPAGGNYRAESRSRPSTPEQVPALAAPVFAAGNLDDTPGDAWPGDPGAGDAGREPCQVMPDQVTPSPGRARPGSRTAARLARDADLADPADPAKMPRSRRRVGFRKGADIDEEMWPTESFGGVTDDQFWDDLASDRPLTTTARSAQHDSGAQKRPVPPPGARVGQRPGDARDLGQPVAAAPARTASFQAAPPQTGPPDRATPDRASSDRAWTGGSPVLRRGALPEHRPSGQPTTRVAPRQRSRRQR